MLHRFRIHSFRDFLFWLIIMTIGAAVVWALPEPDLTEGLDAYLPLHSFMEMVAITMAAMVFGYAWAEQKYNPDGRTLLFGVGFLGVAILDMAHVLSYPGMPNFVSTNDSDKTINFWLMARLVAAMTLLSIAYWPFKLAQKLGYHSKYLPLTMVLALVGLAMYVQLLHPNLMPDTYVDGVGLTPFKVYVEYFLMLLLTLAGIGFLTHTRQNRQASDFLLALSSLMMAMSGWFFTTYFNLADVYHIAGHLYKIIAYGFLYRGVYYITVRQPYETLRASEKQHLATLNTLPDLLFEVDRDGVYISTRANDTQKLAAPIDTIVGKRVTQFLPPEAATTCMKAIAEADRTGSSRGQRILIDVPEGRRYFELSIAKKEFADDLPPTFIVLSRDVTESVTNENKIAFEARLNAALLELEEKTLVEPESVFLERWVSNAKALLSCQTSFVYAVDDHDHSLRLLIWRHGNEIHLRQDTDVTSLPISRMGCWADSIRNRRPVVFNQPLPSLDSKDFPFQTAAPQRLATVPIIDNNKICLLIGVGDKEDAFSAEDIKALQLLGNTLWNSLESKRKDALIHRLSESLEQSPHSVVITDIDAKIVYVNKAFCDISGYGQDEVMGLNPKILQSGLTDPRLYTDLWNSLTKGESWQGEFINRKKNGETYFELVSIYPVMDHLGQTTNYVAHKVDMTQQKASERRIQELSEFDALTGLLNKKSFHDKLQDAIQHAETHHELLSLLWFNIDNFKAINDTLGHEAGDATLVIFAQRLLDGLGSKYVIARYSGDTFAAIIPDHQQTAVAVMAADILSKLKADFTINDQKLSMTASVGIAVFPDDANAAGSLSSAAEIAMYRAKEDGRNSLRFYSGELQEHTKRSLDLSLSLNGAHERGELYVVYQPQLDCTSGQIVGAEALLRWNHPKWGHVTPSEFIPLAEQTGQIIPIGLWVLEQVAHQIQHWDQAGLQKFRFAINVSAVQFVRPGFVDDIVNVMSQASLSTDRIELEITEAVALIDAEQAVKIIQCLHDVGFNVALDDFGTGYSSLSYLKRYAIDKLKIDQSFIQDFDRTKGDHSIVSAIIQIAHSMGIKTIAEGVETTDQLAMLRALGCDEVQGFLLSEPISADAFYHFAQSETRLNTLFSS